jgi:ketosteroid isomerase-like protein
MDTDLSSLNTGAGNRPDSLLEDYANMRHTMGIVIVLISLLAANPLRSQTTEISDVDAIKQVEQTIGSAMVACDVGKLNQIYADNFAAIGSDGKLVTKGTLLANVESLHDKLQWFENGPVDVQVFGTFALAQGFVKEIRHQNGKDTNNQSLWQDILERHEGKWVVWRSAGAKVVVAGRLSTQTEDPAEVAAIQEFENDLGNTMVGNNLEKINRAYADDWATITSTGELFTKEGLLEDFRSGNHKLRAFENGPINVRVLGDVALVQTSVTEKRIQDGKDISGLFIFMDLLKKREGKWVIVRTLAARPV